MAVTFRATERTVANPKPQQTLERTLRKLTLLQPRRYVEKPALCGPYELTDIGNLHYGELPTRVTRGRLFAGQLGPDTTCLQTLQLTSYDSRTQIGVPCYVRSQLILRPGGH